MNKLNREMNQHTILQRIEALEEENRKLRERVAVLESRYPQIPPPAFIKLPQFVPAPAPDWPWPRPPYEVTCGGMQPGVVDP